MNRAAGSYRKNVKQLMIDLEGQSKEIAKAIVEAQKVGIDCLDADDAFAILPDISKELKVHKGRCMEQENTDFDFIEEYRHDVSDRVKALQAAYDQDGAVKRLIVSEKEVHALQKAVKESHRECQECYEEGAASLREQHSELMHYGTIYKRLLKTAQSLTEEHRAKLMNELLEGELEEKKKAQSKAQKKRAKQAKERAKAQSLCNGGRSEKKEEKEQEEKMEEPPEEEDTAWESEYASAGNWKHLLEADTAHIEEAASSTEHSTPRDAGSSDDGKSAEIAEEATPRPDGSEDSSAGITAKTTPSHANDSSTSSEEELAEQQSSSPSSSEAAADSAANGEITSASGQPGTFDAAWDSAVDKWLGRLSGRVASKAQASKCRVVAQRSASYASLPQQAQSKLDHQVSAAWEEEADRNAPVTAPATTADGPARAGSGGAGAPPVTAAPRRIGTAAPGSSVQTALPKRSAEETPPASADASAAAFPAAVGPPSVAAAAALVSANQHLSTPTEGGVGDFLQQLMPRPQPKELGPPSLQQTRQVKPPRPQPKSSSDSSSGAEQSVLRPATPFAPQRVVPASQQAQPQLAGEVCSAQPVPAARTGAEPSSGVALPRQAPASSQVAVEDENPAMVLPMGTLRPNGKSPQSSLLAAAAAKRPALSQPQPPPPPPPRPGAVSGAPPTRALSPAELAWVSKMQQSALVTPPRLAHAPAGGAALPQPPLLPPSPATAEAAQKQGQAGAETAVKAQESGRALVTPPRGADPQSRDRSTDLPPPRLPTVSQQTPQPPPSPLQEAQQRATAPLARAEGLQRGPSAAVLTPQQAPAPRQPEPRQLQGFQVKLSSAGAAAAAAAARQLQPQSRAPTAPPRNVAAVQQTPEERLLAQRQPPPPVPARRSVPAAQPSSSIAMTIGVSSARPAVQPGPARDAVSRGQLAEEARSGASSGNADPTKVERASAQIMQALGLAPGGRRSAAKSTEAKAAAKQTPLLQQKLESLVQPVRPMAAVAPTSAAAAVPAQHTTTNAGQPQGSIWSAAQKPLALQAPAAKPPSERISGLPQHRTAPPSQLSQPVPPPAAKPSSARIADPVHNRAPPPARPTRATAEAAANTALQRRPPPSAAPIQEPAKALPSQDVRYTPGPVHSLPSDLGPADASAEISVPATPLRFGSLPSELIHPVPISVDATLDKLNGVPSKPDKLSGSDAPQPPAATSSAASSAADSAEPGEARVPAAVGQLLSSLFGAAVSSSRPPSETAPSEQQSDSAAEMSSQAADNGASLPPAEQQQLQQHLELGGMRPPENTMQPRQQQRLSLLHRLCTGQHAARKQTGSVSTAGHTSTAADLPGVREDGIASGEAAAVGRAFGPRAKKMHAAMGGADMAAEMLLPLCCPITKDLIQEPVIAADGITYERAAITQWMSRRKVSYVTKAFMRPELVPNRNVQAIIDRLASA
ncbi:hypothetical protein COCSUDRAFT_58120 [Coccomyxa subellipsoidea C-169]|uniref:U-box domain-containing protein n=1 Tax=Coccomyxa subellipsoidea (strain C-169) TaxID=574566 RepID=I0YNB5_COCSC|nr:hypothetical protein COCSUDRAFT_58120 [Coccomyxa subellipsoidea C-169]EIE19884.1 hypothetical protein COCSUDRAFT_58120 [Coccomyxa subellipsoidea C-169]|eukprot:XP_005644428.1 hypothetical protein COCSUDRAFT_58120 [Coccomyxa subellipsoidea C-169]